MVKFYSQSHTYDYPFATVSLAYLLRYPNPYSRHVLSTDVLERVYDPETQQLSTTRLLLKRSRLPSAVLKLLPRGFLGANTSGDSQSYILERSVISIKEGWMRTESRNLDLRTVLDVIERQTYRRQDATPADSSDHNSASSQSPNGPSLHKTDVTTVVTLHSRLGQRLIKRSSTKDTGDDTPAAPTRTNFLLSWSQARLQRSIETIGLSRTSRSQPNAMEGMKVVLERLREGGLVAVLEGMRRDREAMMGGGSRPSGSRT
jgi:4-amino-4-deoxychorismate lyase